MSWAFVNLVDNITGESFLQGKEKHTFACLLLQLPLSVASTPNLLKSFAPFIASYLQAQGPQADHSIWKHASIQKSLIHGFWYYGQYFKSPEARTCGPSETNSSQGNLGLYVACWWRRRTLLKQYASGSLTSSGTPDVQAPSMICIERHFESSRVLQAAQHVTSCKTAVMRLDQRKEEHLAWETMQTKL